MQSYLAKHASMKNVIFLLKNGLSRNGKNIWLADTTGSFGECVHTTAGKFMALSSQ
jgi:hypothetical protein